MTDPGFLALVAATLLLAGFVKGVVGLGLPAVTVALLTLSVGLKPAIAILLAPAFVTNVQQAVTGGHFGSIAKRFWSFFLPATLLVAPGALILARADAGPLAGVLGCSLLVYSVLGLSRPRLVLPSGVEAWASPLCGAVNGLIAGMTGSFTVPGVPYLQAAGLAREALVQAMGILFSLSAAMLALTLGGAGLLTGDLALVSLFAVLPAMLGMALGQRCRRHLSEEMFRRLVLLGLGGVGLHMLVGALIA